VLRTGPTFIALILGVLFVVPTVTNAASIWDSNAETPGTDSVDEIEQRTAAARALPDRPEWPPAPVPRTGQTTTYAIGDDGYHQSGIPWPDPRFTDNNDSTVTDNLTGLIWTKQTTYGFGTSGWETALTTCNELADGSHGLSDGSVPGDWRLANIREVASLMDFSQTRPALTPGHPFVTVRLFSSWASTSHPINTYAGFRYALQTGLFGGSQSKSNQDPCWPVRGGYDVSASAEPTTAEAQAPPPAPVLRTGQTLSFSVGDDGYHQRGLPLTPPDAPRFSDNNDGTVTDNLTGLVWLKAGGGSRGAEDWAAALAFCNDLEDGTAGLHDNSRPGDWRLPNVRELHSLIDYAQHDPALPGGHPFTEVPGGPHWTSTTLSEDPEYAFSMNLREGRLWSHDKQTLEYVWAVRDVVPEPATLSLLALGSCALLRRRVARNGPVRRRRRLHDALIVHCSPVYGSAVFRRVGNDRNARRDDH